MPQNTRPFPLPTDVEIHTLDEIIEQHNSSGNFRFVRSSAADGDASGGAANEPPPEKLAQMLEQSTNAPSSTSVALVPSTISAEDRQNLNDVLLLNSYLSAAANRYMYTLHPNGWDITGPTSGGELTKAVANAKFRVLTEGLGSFLSLNTSSARSLTQSTATADLHLSFLQSLFGDFGFSERTLKELDGVLTSVTKTLSDLKLSWADQSAAFNHLVFVYYFEKVQGLDANLPRMRLFYLHIDQKSWNAAVGKSSVARFDFNMNFDDNIFDMFPEQVALHRTEIQALISKMAGKSFEAVNNLTSPHAIRAD